MNTRKILHKGLIANERGTSLLEVALLLPILLLLVLGIIEIGRYAEAGILVANAARTGVQYGARNLGTAADTTAIQNAAMNDLKDLPNDVAQKFQITSNILCGCSGSGGAPSGDCKDTTCSLPSHEVVWVQVTASGTYKSLFKYPGIPPSIDLNSTASLQVAQ